MTFIVDVTTALPPHYYPQRTITDTVSSLWGDKLPNVNRLEQIHRHVQVDGRYLAYPLEMYHDGRLDSFEASNDAWLKAAVNLAEDTVCALLVETGLRAEAIAQLTLNTTTGIAVPSLDARLMNRIPFSPHLKRMPLFGLGCAGGAAAVARTADFLAGHPEKAAVALTVELCSLTAQPQDLSVANFIASALFGDGAAAVLMVGDKHPRVESGQGRVVGSRSVFFPDTENVMGWQVTDAGFKIVLNAAVPEIARTAVRPSLETFLAEHGLGLEDITHWVAHPGGPKVIEGLEEGLDLPEGALELSRQCLAQMGNLSSASVLFVLKETLKRRPEPGSYGLMMALGPAFAAEFVLIRW